MTTFSPSTVGRVATRMSSIRPAAAAFSEMRPSCGFRRSAMSSFARTFRRVVTPGAIRFGMRCISASTPSMRKRTTSASSCGSKWTSEAPSSAAWKMIELTRRTSGASETPSSASRSSVSSSPSSSRPRLRRAPPGRRTPRRRAPCGAARRGCPHSTRRRARAGTGSRAGARRCRAGLPGRRPRRAARRSRARTGSRRRARARGAESAPPRPARRPSRARSTSGELVADGERAGDPLGRGDALVDERLRERAVARPAARERELVRRDQAGRGRAGRRRARPSC